MSKFVRSVVLAAVAAVGVSGLAARAEQPEKKDAAKGEVLKTIIGATAEFDKDKKTLTVTAVGQVPTGGWKDARLVRRAAKDAPKDGIYEYEMTAVRPTGIVTQVVSKVKASDTWENPPADLKGVRIVGSAEAKTVKVEK